MYKSNNKVICDLGRVLTEEREYVLDLTTMGFDPSWKYM